jgi:uncharacterized integral membrane protein
MDDEFPLENPMRARVVVLVLAILLLAGFAAQNWSEISRPVPLNVAVTTVQAPLALILLGLLALACVLFVASAGAMHTRHLKESREHTRALQGQRDLADKAEASRFTDLRQMLDGHIRESRQRETTANAELDKRLGQHHRELRDDLQRLSQLMSTRLGEMERHLEPPAPGLDPRRQGANAVPTQRPARVEPIREESPARVVNERPAHVIDERVVDERVIEPDPGPGSGGNPIKRWFGR